MSSVSGSGARVGRREWLEADARGGFASGTSDGVRTRRYHALLLSAKCPPTERRVLVNGLDVRACTPEGERFEVSSHRYAGGWVSGDPGVRVESFTVDPWPTWVFALPDGTRIRHEIFVEHGYARTYATWRLLGGITTRLVVRPLLSGRDMHALHHENPAFRFAPILDENALTWEPYEGGGRVEVVHNGEYAHEPTWYRNFEYEDDRARGFDACEDLASPGIFEFDLASSEAYMILCGDDGLETVRSVPVFVKVARSREQARRAGFASPVHRAADAYVVTRGEGLSIIAGYPWFGDWGRDTFISLRGLCIATGRLDDARRVLLEWGAHIDGGMLPNRFPESGARPEYNSVDAGLWFVIAAHEWMGAMNRTRTPIAHEDQEALHGAIQRILCGCAKGTIHGVRMDDDGLLAAGETGVQLTWMDARVDARVITARIGKPVEVQALWLNALAIGGAWAPRWLDVFEAGLASFRAKFWNPRAGCLFDVVDAEHMPGNVDPTIRPNQIFAVGGLPRNLLSSERSRDVVDAVESRLWTPMGLRTLDPRDPAYVGRYAGAPAERDEAYHQGTVWPWLLGSFVEAWVRVRGGSDAVREEARSRFLTPVLEHLACEGLGHVSEVCDGDEPHAPGGCPFQAWSLGELLRLDQSVLALPADVGNETRSGRRDVMAGFAE